MWVVIHHWQDDDYKCISSGVHDVWVFEQEKDAEEKAISVLRELVKERVEEDPSIYEAWAKTNLDGRHPEIEDLDSVELDMLHDDLFKGKFIPDYSQWVTVREAS